MTRRWANAPSRNHWPRQTLISIAATLHFRSITLPYRVSALGRVNIFSRSRKISMISSATTSANSSKHTFGTSTTWRVSLTPSYRLLSTTKTIRLTISSMPVWSPKMVLQVLTSKWATSFTSQSGTSRCIATWTLRSRLITDNLRSSKKWQNSRSPGFKNSWHTLGMLTQKKMCWNQPEVRRCFQSPKMN